MAVQGILGIRRLQDESCDYQLLARWLSDQRVLEFFDGRDKPQGVESVRATYGPGIRGEDPVVPCFITWDERPIGMVLYYALASCDGPRYRLSETDGSYGIEIFIGEPEFWGKGIGAAVISTVVRYLYQEAGARLVFLDPHVSNERAVRCYEKAGFRKVCVLPSHELHEGEYRDAWLMVADPPARALKAA